jgi:hypothetical protein
VGKGQDFSAADHRGQKNEIEMTTTPDVQLGDDDDDGDGGDDEDQKMDRDVALFNDAAGPSTAR